MNFSLNQKLAFSAFSLSFLALIGGLISPLDQPPIPEKELDYISVIQLATEIKDKQPIQLIDLRNDSSFNAFHIPTAKSASLAQLLHQELYPTPKTVLYSGDDSISEQAFYMMTGKGIDNLYVLEGGIQDWYNRILYPKMPKVIPESDKELALQVKTLSAYFGGRSVFVDEGNPLDYYRGIKPNIPIIESRLVRMGC